MGLGIVRIIVTLALGLLSASLAAEAQQPAKTHRIGVLVPRSCPSGIQGQRISSTAAPPGVRARRAPETSGTLPFVNLTNWIPPSISTSFRFLWETSLRPYTGTGAVNPAFA